MKRVLRTTFLAVLVMLMMVSMLAPGAFAAGNTVTAEIPVKISMEGAVLPETDTVPVTVKALDGAPEPEDGYKSFDVVCDGSIGQGEVNIPITYNRVGVYEYEITVYPGEYYLADYGETLVYDVKVTVYNNDDYTGLVYAVAAYLQGEEPSQKYNEVQDANVYYPPMDLTVVKKWIDQDSKRPTGINIQLYQDGEAYGDPVRLNKSNDWQTVYKALDPRCEWTVKEVKVPAGYTVSYRFTEAQENADGTLFASWRVTNTGSLLQTGQLNWPIPVLVMLGAMFMAVGMLLFRRKEEESNG